MSMRNSLQTRSASKQSGAKKHIAIRVMRGCLSTVYGFFFAVVVACTGVVE